MKQFELSALGLEEVSSNEAANINGGFAWVVFGVAVVVGLLLSETTAAKEQPNEVDAITGA